MKRILFIIILFIVGTSAGFSKTEKFGTWIELEFRKDFLKKFSFSIVPELRFQDQFQLDEYMVQGKLSYDVFSFFSLAGTYRVGIEIKNKGNVSYSRFALDAQASKEINRFEVSLRGRFTNFSELENENSSKYIRPRVKLEYRTKGKRIRPYTSYELFQNLTKAEMQKSRFDVGFTRRLGDLHRVGLYYRLQDYFTDKASIHILGIEYRLRF
ncbi:MAG: DUF2490 domain-containing protein [Mariniphaga sp.]|nr:DUF2490 domain-containing protein [Mariniphaga sp.]